MKNSKQVTVEEEGGAGIPFSALKDIFKYRASVTNLCPNTNVETIKNHINSKLRVNALVKSVSPVGAPYLSLILLFTSESDTLDLRMTGLWPKGTVIKQCIPPNQRKKYGNKINQRITPDGRGQRHGGEYNHQGQNNQQRYGHSSRTDTSRDQVVGSSFIHANRDQELLRQQWRV